LVVLWSDAPAKAARSDSSPAIRCSSARVSTSHARWYRPTALLPAVEAAAAAPTSNRPRSWSLVDPDACRKTPGHAVDDLEAEDVTVEPEADLEVADELPPRG